MSEAMEKNKEEEPKAKRPRAEEEEEEEEQEETTPLRNDEGNAYVELSPKRRCTVREWKGNILVDIREVRTVMKMSECGM